MSYCCKCDEMAAHEKKTFFCSPAKVPMFLETEDGSSEVKGLFAPMMNLYLDVLAKKCNETIKFIAYPGFGDKGTNSNVFTGCFGQVQRGEADTIFSLVDYPMDMVNISQGHVLFDDRIGYIGARSSPMTSLAHSTHSMYRFGQE